MRRAACTGIAPRFPDEAYVLWLTIAERFVHPPPDGAVVVLAVAVAFSLWKASRYNLLTTDDLPNERCQANSRLLCVLCSRVSRGGRQTGRYIVATFIRADRFRIQATWCTFGLLADVKSLNEDCGEACVCECEYPI